MTKTNTTTKDIKTAFVEAFPVARNNFTAIKGRSIEASQVLKSVKNVSVQGLSVILEVADGYESRWIEPREVIQVPENQVSQQMRNLHRRRLINIS